MGHASWFWEFLRARGGTILERWLNKYWIREHFIWKILTKTLLASMGKIELYFFVNNRIECKWAMKNFGTSSSCAVGIQQSGTITIEHDITETGQKLSIGKCVLCEKKPMFVTDNIRDADGLGTFFKKLIGASAEASKKLD